MLYSLRVEDFCNLLQVEGAARRRIAKEKPILKTAAIMVKLVLMVVVVVVVVDDDLSTRVTGEKTARQGREENVGEKEKNIMI